MRPLGTRRSRPRRRILRWLVVGGILAAGLYGAVLHRTGSLLLEAQSALLEHQMGKARNLVQAASFYRVRRGQVLEARGILELLAGSLESAQDLLVHARETGNTRSGMDPNAIASLLATTAQYPALDLLAGHRRQAGGAQVDEVWRAEARLGQGDLLEAAALLKSGPEGNQPLAARRRRLGKILQQRQAAGQADILFDRGGRPVYGRTVPGGKPVLHVPDLAPALTEPGGALQFLSPSDLAGQVHLTIDLAYQKAAHAALGRYAGAFVAIDPKTGAILALVSHTDPQDSTVQAYRQLFEPGSIIKMITLAGALDSDLNLDRLFPLNCTGNMTLDGKVFYDWIRHGSVAGPAEATAVSCNLAFAAMGLEIGQARLDDTLKRFGF
ncbi:MAG: penicillin-binding transpeptidase domain-containing protein, partial [Acidobacteriota bacterium]